MLKQTEHSSLDGHLYLKCKSCKNEFYVVGASHYMPTILFCPYCGDYAHKHDRLRMNEEPEEATVTAAMLRGFKQDLS